jgi:hypothetical protein
MNENQEKYEESFGLWWNMVYANCGSQQRWTFYVKEHKGKLRDE